MPVGRRVSHFGVCAWLDPRQRTKIERLLKSSEAFALDYREQHDVDPPPWGAVRAWTRDLLRVKRQATLSRA
ncbi:MAG: hypothetical protein J4F97_06745 [Pseudomonadales bacterium]|nr:hypothetical protein [Pseudomonadales bacterium]